VTGYDWLEVLIGIGVALLITWLLFIATLAIGRPKGSMLTESLRLLPDLLQLLRRIAADKHQAPGVRVRLVLLLAYLAFPIDLIPDFIPVLGYADDAVIVTWTLRSIARRVGIDELHRHWPGTEDGFQALSRMTGLTERTSVRSVKR
jgi:uncharacterized membrane protein YkvA (DUF1232 family)